MAITVKIDEFAELMGIIAYFGGQNSYKNNYTKEIDKYFALYKKHQIVKKVKLLDIDKWISLALLLEYKRGSFVLRKKEPFLDNSDEILKLLADFYKTTSFHKFFRQQARFYDEACAEFEKEVCSLNEEWFKSFFGDFEQGDFSVISIPVLNRFILSSKNETIVGECSDNILSVIRLFCHIFINPLLYNSDKRQKILQPCAVRLLEFSKWSMQQQGFGDWRVLINEYLVRAVANVYMQENRFTKQAVRDDIVENVGRGFYLMPELVGYLNKYRYCRDKFKTFGEFYFEVARYLSAHIEKEIKRVDDVVSVILEV